MQLEKNTEKEKAKLVTVRVDDQISPAELAQLAKERPTCFTPHLGNKWREDMYLMEVIGVPTVNFTENQSKIDVLDAPDKIKFDGEVHDLTDPELQPIMTPYLKFREGLTEGRINGLISELEAKNPGHLHMKSTKLALPKSSTNTFPEEFVLGRENELLRKLITAFQAEVPEVFSRYVTEQGEVKKVRNFSSGFTLVRNEESDLITLTKAQVERAAEDYFRFSERTDATVNRGEAMKEGSPIPRNELRLILTAIKQMLTYYQNGQKVPVNSDGAFEAVLVSGPSMIKYSRNADILNMMNQYYETLREIGKSRFGLPMPAKVVLKMIPGSALSYLPIEGENDLLGALNHFVPLERAREQLRNRLSKKEIPYLEAKDDLQSLSNAIREAVDAIADAGNQAPFVSQYDLLRGKALLSAEKLEGPLSLSFKTHQMILDVMLKRKK
ncbi:hypothetical protein IT411_03985 [Candidatus Peregrinibacteria bacterium]|nr:hypothetical protein [Candidatus Peregrinibacteria bacterium]